MKHRLEVYDFDVGDTIYFIDCYSRKELIQEIKDILIAYNPDDMIDPNEIDKLEASQWDYQNVIETIEGFTFDCPFIDISVRFPGSHRMIKIKTSKE